MNLANDPLVVDLLDSIRWGIVGGSILGSVGGFYVLKQALINPEDPNKDEFLKELLEKRSQGPQSRNDRRNGDSLSYARAPGIKITLVNWRF